MWNLKNNFRLPFKTSSNNKRFLRSLSSVFFNIWENLMLNSTSVYSARVTTGHPCRSLANPPILISTFQSFWRLNWKIWGVFKGFTYDKFQITRLMYSWTLKLRFSEKATFQVLPCQNTWTLNVKGAPQKKNCQAKIAQCTALVWTNFSNNWLQKKKSNITYHL